MMGAPLYERDGEIAILGRLISRATSGRGSLVAIEGPAGIGKTRLLAHARQQAASAGWRVFDTRCTPLSTSIAYGLPRDWFGTLAHRGAGSHPFDGPGQVLADLVDGRTPGIGDLVYGVRWVLEDLSTARPVLLIADDLQWADEASLQTDALLVNALRHLPCLIVYGVRTGERVSAPEALGRVLAASRVLTPLPLSKEAVAEQVRAVRPRASEAEIDDVHRTSGGVPFYVTELLSSDSRTPEAVVGSVAGRLSRLPGTAGDTARAVCVLGPEASVGTVAELTHLSLDVVADDISALVGAQILSLDHGSLTARHPLVADVILAGSSTHEVADLHARAARILAGRGASRAVIAAHLLQTLPGENPDTRARLREQGEAAMRTGALDVAVRYFERALAEGAVGPSEVGLLSSLARALAGLREIDAALGPRGRAGRDRRCTRQASGRVRRRPGDRGPARRRAGGVRHHAGPPGPGGRSAAADDQNGVGRPDERHLAGLPARPARRLAHRRRRSRRPGRPTRPGRRGRAPQLRVPRRRPGPGAGHPLRRYR